MKDPPQAWCLLFWATYNTTKRTVTDPNQALNDGKNHDVVYTYFDSTSSARQHRELGLVKKVLDQALNESSQGYDSNANVKPVR